MDCRRSPYRGGGGAGGDFLVVFVRVEAMDLGLGAAIFADAAATDRRFPAQPAEWIDLVNRERERGNHWGGSWCGSWRLLTCERGGVGIHGDDDDDERSRKTRR